MTTKRRALVIGGSMSGLLAAIMLSRRGWDVEVFERVEKELAGRGAGIVAQAELMARMKVLGLETRDLGVTMTTRKILDQSGHVTVTLECPQMLTAWERVYRVLRDAFPAERYHRGEGLKAFEQSEQGIIAHLSDGRAIVRLMEEPILQPIYDLESPRLAFGRVAIIGDAAFVARPHVAAGVSKAADDAAALAEALDTVDVEAALRRFETQRLPENKKIIERARHLGAYLQATQTAEERARSARHSIPQAVLAETAVLDFLRT